MSYDLLFKDFVFEVYNSKRMDSDPITDYDIMRYFERKSSEDDAVAGWGYETLFKLRRLYARVLFESGLLRNPTGMRETTTPIISIPVLDALVQSGFRDYVGATVGSP